MLYISAQPDQTYFIWQLEIQLRNFRTLGICKDHILVLASYQPEKGLNPLFQKFIEENKHLASFYTYPDLRDDPKYTSSIRPNILKQHFAKYPGLEKETLFYHDSDILFSRIPQIDNVEANPTCYVSDTCSYLDIDYIRRSGSEELLKDMANIVGIPVGTIEKNKQHTGGAQYILKSINAAFWEKAERDSEALYVLMKDYNKELWEREYPEKKEFRSKKRGIQAWCADMWAVLWNLWYFDKSVEIHSEMDFSWPYSVIDEWESKAIQHYSGNIEDKNKFFKKNEYLNYMPWYDNALLTIPDSSCSYRIVENIQARKAELDRERPDIGQSCIVCDARGYSDLQLDNYMIIKTYIQKYLAVDMYLLKDQQDGENGIQIDRQNLLGMLHQEYNSVLVLPLDYLDYLPDIGDIQSILEDNNEFTTFYFPEELYTVDSLFVETFSKVLDMELLHINKGKFNTKEVDTQKYILYTVLPRYAEERKKMLDQLFSRNTLLPENVTSLPTVYCLIA